MAALYFYHLGSLTNGLAAVEAKLTITPAGWHGIYNQPLFAPITLLRSIVFYFLPNYGDSLLRASNVVVGFDSLLGFLLCYKVLAWS